MNHLTTYKNQEFSVQNRASSIENRVSTILDLFMQNKANFKKVKFYVTKVLTKDYVKRTLGVIGKTKPNKANSKPIKANLKNAKMNLSVFKTSDYEKMSNWAIYLKQSQFKPKRTQFYHVEASGEDGSKPISSGQFTPQPIALGIFSKLVKITRPGYTSGPIYMTIDLYAWLLITAGLKFCHFSRRICKRYKNSLLRAGDERNVTLTTKISLRYLLICAVFCLLLITSTVSADDRPQWGQRFSRNMVSDETGLPDTFDPATGKNVKWVVSLGTQTYSTPVVGSGKVLIGTNNEKRRDPRHKGDRGVMMCFNEKDGSFCWQLIVPKLGKDPFIDWPRVGMCSSPTIDGDRAYILSNKGEVICLDLNGMANGNDGPYRDEGRHMAPKDVGPMELAKTDADIIWLCDLIAEQGVHVHDGAHSSILVHGNFLYLNTSNGLNSKHTGVFSPEAPSLVVIDKMTGKLVARENEKISQKIFHCTWSSPSLGNVNGRPLVFFGGGDGICYAFDAVKANKSIAKNLKNVWKFDCDPTAPKENIHKYIRNRKESPSNIKSIPVFYKNRIYVTVGGDIWWGKHKAWLKCIDATKTGDVTDSAQLWSYPVNQHCCSTPSIYNGLVFIADCGQRIHGIHCVDAETGKPYWTHETKGDMWASTLVADGKVYIGTRRGQFLVLAASKEKKIISEIELDSPTNSTPVAANGVLYVTTMKKLYALEKSSE